MNETFSISLQHKENHDIILKSNLTSLCLVQVRYSHVSVNLCSVQDYSLWKNFTRPIKHYIIFVQEVQNENQEFGDGKSRFAFSTENKVIDDLGNQIKQAGDFTNTLLISNDNPLRESRHIYCLGYFRNGKGYRKGATSYCCCVGV